MTAIYSIDDGDGNRLTTGLSDHNVWRIAQRMANDRQEPVFVYAFNEDCVAVRPAFDDE